jgi:hypothetical protein
MQCSENRTAYFAVLQLTLGIVDTCATIAKKRLNFESVKIATSDINGRECKRPLKLPECFLVCFVGLPTGENCCWQSNKTFLPVIYLFSC